METEGNATPHFDFAGVTVQQRIMDKSLTNVLQLYLSYTMMSKNFINGEKRICQPYWTLYCNKSFEHLQAKWWEIFTYIARDLLLKLL